MTPTGDGTKQLHIHSKDNQYKTCLPHDGQPAYCKMRILIEGATAGGFTLTLTSSLAATALETGSKSYDYCH
jgi:hypothetical protein